MSKSNFLDTQLLNHVLRATPYSAPSTIYVALYTAAPTPSTSGTEVTGGSYARQPSTFTAPAPDTVTNLADVNFPTATVDWGTIVAFALCDAASAGNILYFANLAASRTVLTGDQFRFPAGQLAISED